MVALTHEEITAIKKEVIAECKNIFVQIDECNTVQTENQKKFAYDDKRIEKQEEFIGGLKKFGWAIISVLIGEVVVSLITLLKDFA